MHKLLARLILTLKLQHRRTALAFEPHEVNLFGIEEKATGKGIYVLETGDAKIDDYKATVCKISSDDFLATLCVLTLFAVKNKTLL